MIAYVFAGELLCQKCADGWKANRLAYHADRLQCLYMKDCKLTAEEALQAEDTGDSNDYPQGPIADGGGEADCPQHCGSCGVFLENPLTTDGMAYVRKQVRAKGAAMLNVWAPFYGLTDADCQEEGMKCVIQARFMGSHGRMANQFFGGIGTYSHAPVWVNLVSDAVQYDSAEVAGDVLSRIHSRRATHAYSVVLVVLVADADGDGKPSALKV